MPMAIYGLDGRGKARNAGYAHVSRVHQHAPSTYQGARRLFRRLENLDAIQEKFTNFSEDKQRFVPSSSRSSPRPGVAVNERRETTSGNERWETAS